MGKTEQTFDSFNVRAENRFAYHVALAAIERPGLYNPIVICGPTWTGKSHLLYAVENAVRAQDTNKSIVHISAHHFINVCIAAIEEGLRAETKQAYQTADYLLLENLEDMCGKDSCQQFIASVICDAVAEGHQVMLTSAVDLQRLGVLNASLRNCECGVFADVGPFSTDRGGQ